MIDDIVAISQCGIDSVMMNSFLNSKTNLKKLQFGVNKCKRMHVGMKNHYCPDLKIDKWKLKKIEKFN